MAQEIKKSDTTPLPVQRYIDPLTAMRAELDNVFESFLGPGYGARNFGRLPSMFRGIGSGNGAVVPSIDVRETDKELIVEAELPGIDEKDLHVTLNNGVLTLKGEKKAEREQTKDDYHVTERSYGSFQRSFKVGDAVDADKVVAAFDKGVLKVTMPKRPEAARAEKRIPISKG